jgi:hypothetical protein
MGQIARRDLKVVVEFMRSLQSDNNSRAELACAALMVAMADAGASSVAITAFDCRITADIVPVDGGENV